MTTRVALITGGTGGIGTAICHRMSTDGMRVIAAHHPADLETAGQWREEQAAAGYDIDILPLDVSSYEECSEKLAKLLSDYGSVDIIVNCAGITRDSSFKKMQKDQWYDVLNVNLNSVFNVTRPLWNNMLGNGFGRIVNISSINGQRGQFGQTNYSAAKAGMHGFTMALAQEGASNGITVNTVSPGYVSTAMTEAIREDVRDAIVSDIPMGRMGSVEEIASAVHFLVADSHEYITGANLPINGGLFIS